jgi:hypothetical protein
VVRGFTISNAGAIAANTLELVTADGVLINVNATASGSMLWVSSDRAVEVLNPSTNTRIDGSWTAGATNYVGLDLSRTADTETTSIIQFKDPDTGLETPRSVPTAQTLDYVIVINTLPFSSQPNVVPIATVTLNSSSNVSTMTDARNMLFRLGQGGDAGDAEYTYPWPEERTETTTLGTSLFSGGDKAIESDRDWRRAIMSRIWEVGGGEYWYSASADRNATMVSTGTTFANGENFDWDGTDLLWKGIRFLFDNSTAFYNTVTDQTVVDSGLTTLADGQCIYVDLDRSTAATLVAQRADLDSLGSGNPPGSRWVMAWRQGSQVFTRNSPYPVGDFFSVATTTSTGIVKLSRAATTPSSPIVISDAGGTITSATAATALTITAFTNQIALAASGNGTGSGVSGTSGAGAGGHGVLGTCAGTTGAGVRGEAGNFTGSVGVHGGGNASSDSYGVFGRGNAAGAGILGIGDLALAAPTTAGEGVVGLGDTGAAGVKGIGGATSGDGGWFTGTGSGDGVSATSAGTGHGVNAVGGTGGASAGYFQGGAAGPGVTGTGGSGANGIVGVGGTTSGNGGYFTGTGSGTGAWCIGGATGYGVYAIGATGASGAVGSIGRTGGLIVGGAGGVGSIGAGGTGGIALELTGGSPGTGSTTTAGLALQATGGAGVANDDAGGHGIKGIGGARFGTGSAGRGVWGVAGGSGGSAGYFSAAAASGALTLELSPDTDATPARGAMVIGAQLAEPTAYTNGEIYSDGFEFWGYTKDFGNTNRRAPIVPLKAFGIVKCNNGGAATLDNAFRLSIASTTSTYIEVNVTGDLGDVDTYMVQATFEAVNTSGTICFPAINKVDDNTFRILLYSAGGTGGGAIVDPQSAGMDTQRINLSIISVRY